MIPLAEKYDMLLLEYERLYNVLEATHHKLQSQKVWGGMQYVYNPIHPVIYLPLVEKICKELEYYHHTMELLTSD